MGMLLEMSPLERKVFHRLGVSGKEDADLAMKEGLTRAQVKRAIASLVKKGIAEGKIREGNIVLYSRSRDFILDEQPWKKNADWAPKEASLSGEKVLEMKADETFVGSSMSFLKGNARVMDIDKILYPVYIVKIMGEGRTRYCLVDAIHGHIDEDLTAISKDLV